MSEKDNPLAKVENSQLISVKKEVASLLQTVSRQGEELNLLKEISTNNVLTKPNEPVLRELWNLVYTSLINKVFERGPAFWNNKAATLRNELQLCVIRADEAVENYVAVRNTCPDPVIMAQEKWAREQLAK